MATVQNVYDLVKAMLSKPRTNLKEEYILAALNEGAHEAWKVLSTFEGSQNWFVSIDTGNAIGAAMAVHRNRLLINDSESTPAAIPRIDAIIKPSLCGSPLKTRALMPDTNTTQ